MFREFLLDEVRPTPLDNPTLPLACQPSTDWSAALGLTLMLREDLILVPFISGCEGH